MKYYNETRKEYLLRLIKRCARGLSNAEKQMGIYRVDKDIWIDAESIIKEGLR